MTVIPEPAALAEIYAGGTWVRADALRCGAGLVRLDLSRPRASAAFCGTVSAIEFANGADPVYHIQVSGQHNYFAEGILVHNKPPNISG